MMYKLTQFAIAKTTECSFFTLVNWGWININPNHAAERLIDISLSFSRMIDIMEESYQTEIKKFLTLWDDARLVFEVGWVAFIFKASFVDWTDKLIFYDGASKRSTWVNGMISECLAFEAYVSSKTDEYCYKKNNRCRGE